LCIWRRWFLGFPRPSTSDQICACHQPLESYIAQARSELSASGAPTPDFMAPEFKLHAVLVIAFSMEGWLSAGAKCRRRHTIVLLFVLGSWQGWL
jgi:hypothetical protein